MLLLPACVTPTAALGGPSRSEAEQALSDSMRCVDQDRVTNCANPEPWYVLRAVRCVPVEEVVPRPQRLLCHFSGRVVTALGSRRPLDIQCAYLRRNQAGEWIVDSIPDADLCEPA